MIVFASNVVLSRRPENERPDVGRNISQSNSPARADGASPSVDEVADAVVRATSRTAGLTSNSAAQFPQQATSPLPPSSPSSEQRRTPDQTPPISAAGPLHRVLEGTVIDTVLTNRLDGTSAAPVNCLVTNALYSHTGRQVLIPAGARILGETKPVQAFGETRLAVSFHRLLMPDGRTYRLDQFLGLNQIGDAGLRDKVNQPLLVHVRSGGGGWTDQRAVPVPGKCWLGQRRWQPNDRHRRRRRRCDGAGDDAGDESVSQQASDHHHPRGTPREGVSHQRYRAAGIRGAWSAEPVLTGRTLCFADSC